MHNEAGLERFKDQIAIPLQMKTEELILLGYDTATVELVWDSVKDKLRRRKPEEIEFHEIVAEVLSLQAGHYIQTMTRKSWAELDK